MEFFVVIVSWLLFGGATSYFASQRGRDPLAWFVIGMLLGILGLLLLFLLPPVGNSAPEKEEPMPEVKESSQAPARLVEWYYLDANRNQIGPISYSQLSKITHEGQIKADTLVWSQGMANWQRVDENQELKSLLNF
jgi:hypothetical protein